MQTALKHIADKTIAVIGDVMLDIYVSGDVKRISPEAPVPIILVSEERSVAGGAANVAANLAALGAKVLLVGVSGVDGERESLLAELRVKGNIDYSRVIPLSDRPTSTKLRVIGGHQQIVRIDREDIRPLAPATEAELLVATCSAIDAADAVVISDYGKGVCSNVLLETAIERARGAGKIILVDPKRRDFSAYYGATLLTPNRRELADATQMTCETDAEAASAAAKASTLTGSDLVLTRSEKGVSFFPINGDPIHLPTVAQGVFDVSGAGDTVVATLAAALAVDLPMSDALQLANHAAGIVVSKLGTATVTLDEIARSFSIDLVSSQDGQIMPLTEVVALRFKWAEDNLTVGFTNGCFDLLHPGHVSLLRHAALACDRLIVGINSDASVRRLKGATRPVQSEAARAAVLGAIRGVSAVLVFDEETPRDLINKVQPDVLIKGADYSISEVVGADIVIARGGQVVLSPLAVGHSTTNLIARAFVGLTE